VRESARGCEGVQEFLREVRGEFKGSASEAVFLRELNFPQVPGCGSIQRPSRRRRRRLQAAKQAAQQQIKWSHPSIHPSIHPSATAASLAVAAVGAASDDCHHGPRPATSGQQAAAIKPMRNSKSLFALKF
jgi:hypothetical protein